MDPHSGSKEDHEKSQFLPPSTHNIFDDLMQYIPLLHIVFKILSSLKNQNIAPYFIPGNTES